MGVSNQAGPRFFRGFLAELGRAVLPPANRPTPELWNTNTISASWLGHSTVLVNFYGLTILTDPVLFRRIGANLKIGTVGPKRMIDAALTPEELPDIDIILLSHAHMDHLDLPSLHCFSRATRVVTAHNTADLLAPTQLRAHCTELKWGEKAKIITRRGDAIVQAFEVNHWGARWRHDSYRGYNGYVIEREGRKIIFGGDTAWTSTFRPLRGRGGYELAIMPIGSYKPWIWCHCNPEQAVSMANDSGAKYILPVHFQTFALGREPRHEPMERLRKCIEPERIALSEIGETFVCN
ncbi:MAG TPA: MBL fold metallo-hydrolase [Verrucomicrobiae bacterium]|jgi:L-ascorbate metabolism protein UlaG (beta-lactamase superfamily)